MKKCLVSLLAGASLAAVYADGEMPSLSDVTLSQTGGRVTITYTLANGPAVVTADILTNAVVASEGVSIGAKNFWNMSGDVNKLVTGDGPHTITWKPYNSWPGHLITDGSVRAKLTAWETNTPPPYMVIDLSKKSTPRYYASVDALPGGLHENPDYKLTKVVMKRIEAAEKTVAIGPAGEIGKGTYEQDFFVTFDADYYIGVFEITRGQWAQYDSGRSNGFNVESAYRPMAYAAYSQVRWNEISENWGNDGSVADYPAAPRANSFIGRARTATGIDVDLPTAAQWEYAARGGFGPGYWGDGSPIVATDTDANLDKLGRYKNNGGEVSEAYPENQGVEQKNWTSANGTAVVGSYKPNGYGLYDMHGNVSEWVMDWWYNDQSSFAGNPPTSASDGSRLCTIRGGSFNNSASCCRAAYRAAMGGTPGNRVIDVGFRLAAPCIAK